LIHHSDAGRNTCR